MEVLRYVRGAHGFHSPLRLSLMTFFSSYTFLLEKQPRRIPHDTVLPYPTCSHCLMVRGSRWTQNQVIHPLTKIRVLEILAPFGCCTSSGL